MILLFLATALAGTCTVHNETGVRFTVDSGPVHGQRLSGYTVRSIASGGATAVSDDGRYTLGWSCSDGGSVRIVSERGVPVVR